MLSSVAFFLVLICGYGQAETHTARELYQFPSSPYESPENVGLRANGDLLITVTSTPTIWLLDPTQSNPLAQLLYTFPDATATLGITETSPDRFAVIVGNITVATRSGTPGSFSIWSVDFTAGSDEPTVTKVAAVPHASILNGMTHLKANPDIVLAVDTEAGNVYGVNVSSGAVEVAIPSAAFGPSGSDGIGLNGIHVDASGNYLYFTNSFAGTFGRIPIDSDGHATGNAINIATDIAGNIFDDFVLNNQYIAYITNHPNSITEVSQSGQESVFYNSTTLNQPTSAILSADGETLYVVTAGSPTTASGQVFAIDV